jgi:uncharacterized membrane protein
MRSFTPLAVISVAARRNFAPVVALAAGELLGDKLPFAPDRIVAPGIAARIVTGAVSGMALARREDRTLAAVLGAAGAVGAAYLTFGLRKRAMRRFGQTPTGLIEDLATVCGSVWLVAGAFDRKYDD